MLYAPMLMCADVRRVSSLGHNSGLWPHGTISIELMAAVRLVIILALAALETRVRLRSNSYALSRLDECHLGSNAESCADNF